MPHTVTQTELASPALYKCGIYDIIVQQARKPIVYIPASITLRKKAGFHMTLKSETKERLLSLCVILSLCVSSLVGCGTESRSSVTVQPTEPVETSQPESPPVSEKSSPSPDCAETAPTTVQPTPEDTAPSEAPPLPADPRNDACFDRSVFIGDSIMEGIRQYVAKERKSQPILGEAKFLTSVQGITLADLVGDNDPCMYYSYGGEEAPLEELIDSMDVDRIFLLLGLNDLASTTAGSDEIVARYIRLVNNLKKSFPGVEVIVMTTPPKVASSWLPDYTTNRSFGNKRIDEFVDALVAMCDENEIAYVDVHSALQNEDGALPDEFCRDGYIHLNNAGSKVVVDELYAFAAGRN